MSELTYLATFLSEVSGEINEMHYEWMDGKRLAMRDDRDFSDHEYQVIQAVYSSIMKAFNENYRRLKNDERFAELYDREPIHVKKFLDSFALGSEGKE